MAAKYVLPVPEAVFAPIAARLELDVRFLYKLVACCWQLHVRGIPFKLGELKRSRETQARLYAQGRTAPGPIVTNAKPGQSYHESGRAGHIVVDHKYRTQLGECAEGAGLVWGGRWTTTFGKDGDWQHVEDRG